MGLALAWKPAGIGSQDFLRHLSKTHNLIRDKKKGRSQIGHCGTLDPFAEGVLVVGWQEGTKILAPLMGANKTYLAEIVLGVTSETLDPTSEIIKAPENARVEIQQKIHSFLSSQSKRSEFLKSKIGFHDQIPPRYSALKIEGQRAYSMARDNSVQSNQLLDEALLAKKRQIQILKAEDVSANVDSGIWQVRLEVSTGTYIRSLARDFSQEIVGFPGHLKSLVRESVGPWVMSQKVELQPIGLSDLAQVFEIQEISEKAATEIVQYGRVSKSVLAPTGVNSSKQILLVKEKSLQPVAWLESLNPLQIGRVFVQDPLAF